MDVTERRDASFTTSNEIKTLQEQISNHHKIVREREYQINCLKLKINEIEKKFSDFYDFNSIAFFLIDKKYQIENVNFQGTFLVNYSRKQLLNNNFLNLINSYQQNAFKKCIDNLVLGKKKQICELELLQKGGKRKYVSAECVSLKNELIQLQLLDITEIRHLESKQKRLNHTLEMVANLLQNVSDAIAMLDKEFYLKIINPSFVTFFSKIFFMKIKEGMNFFTHIAESSEYKEQLYDGCQQALLGRETTVVMEHYSSQYLENSYYYEINFKTIYNPRSHEPEIILLIKDLTDFYLRKKLRMKEHSKLAHEIRLNTMEGMASALAHEINQPLTAIFLYCKTCILQLEKRDKLNNLNFVLSIVNKIMAQAKHASEVISRMTNFFQRDVYLPEDIDINELIQNTMVFLDYELTYFKLKINLKLEEEMPLLNVDKIQIMQVILNLARNSVEAMREGTIHSPILTIETINKGDYIELHFRDNGPGIPAEYQDKILSSYFTTKPQGTGLGLSICRNFVEAHGGKLYVQSHDGHGAWFIFTLPVIA
jgi:two-component system sensor kinase FixL